MKPGPDFIRPTAEALVLAHLSASSATLLHRFRSYRPSTSSRVGAKRVLPCFGFLSSSPRSPFPCPTLSNPYFPVRIRRLWPSSGFTRDRRISPRRLRFDRRVDKFNKVHFRANRGFCCPRMRFPGLFRSCLKSPPLRGLSGSVLQAATGRFRLRDSNP
jgi:hypothetical protein